MANSNRYLRGNRKITKWAVDSATVIEVGDLVYLATDDVRPASDLTWDTNGDTTRATFANTFVGVAVDQSKDGDTDEIGVDISPDSIYQMDCDAATFENGDTIGPNDSASLLEDQKVVAETTAASACGFVQKRYSANTTIVECSFASAFHPGSSNANAQIG